MLMDLNIKKEFVINVLNEKNDVVWVWGGSSTREHVETCCWHISMKKQKKVNSKLGLV
jgi:hypothetical protein